MSYDNRITVLDRLNQLGLYFSKADVIQIELMARRYFSNKLNYRVRLAEVDFYNDKKIMGLYKPSQHKAVVDKAIFKFYEAKNRKMMKQIRLKPNDLKHTLEKSKRCINNMIKIIYANPFLKRNRYQLWKKKPVMTPMRPDGNLLDFIDTRKDKIEKHLIPIE